MCRQRCSQARGRKRAAPSIVLPPSHADVHALHASHHPNDDPDVRHRAGVMRAAEGGFGGKKPAFAHGEQSTIGIVG